MKQKLTLHFIIGSLGILSAIIIGVITRFGFLLTAYVQFDADQVRDAWVYFNMQQGQWVGLGPAVSIGNFAVPPLYYYFVFPFTLISPHPVWQVLPNALCSFISIPLLMLLIWQMTDRLSRSKRILAVGIAGVWWSVQYQDILLSNREWNPGPIIAALLAFILLAAWLLKNKTTRWKHLLGWTTLGWLVAFLISLHGTLWIMIPIIFLIILVWYYVAHRLYLGPVLAVSSSVVSLLPYWIFEWLHQGMNTRAFINTLLQVSREYHSPYEYGIHILSNYVKPVTTVYLINFPIEYLFLDIFFIVCVVLLCKYYSGNNILLKLNMLIWIFYGLVSIGYWGVIYYHYELPIILGPLVSIVILLVQIPYRGIAAKIFGGMLSVIIVVSMVSNLKFDIMYLNNIYGKEQLASVNDIATALTRLPVHAPICEPNQLRRDRMEYIDITMTHRQLSFFTTCLPGDYVVHHKFVVHSELDSIQFNPLPTIYSQQVYDTPALLVLQIQ